MSLQRKITKIGGSLGIIVPRDLAEIMGVTDESVVRLSMVGRQMIVDPEDDIASEDAFRHAYATVLRRYSPMFKMLADHDAGKTTVLTSRRR